ncbi:MAG: PIG-L family deacetylase [Oscillospiraceae bacterium]|nr:PIG-L family deacetylase [Oscillospiraceae bacterium]
MKRTLFVIVISLLALCLLIVFGLLSGEAWIVPDAPEDTPPPEDTAPSAEIVIPPETPEETPFPVGDPQYAAEQLPLSTDMDAVAEDHLFDDNYYSDYTFPAGTVITLTAEKEIDSIYIIFGSYPGEWTLRTDGGVQRCGQEGFLHECVKLDAPSKEVQICLGDEDVLIRDLYAFSDGYLPGFVQTWQTLEGGADILVFSTHYDDELLFLGGLIPYYSAVRGLRVQVVYMTSNYMSNFSDYRFRPHEALNGLWVCGDHFYPVTNDVRDYECPGYWTAVYYYGTEQFAEFQTEMIRRFKPLVVVTQAEDGEYGHGAHILTVRSVEEAVEAAADPERFPESAETYGVWDTPKTYLHNYAGAGDYTWLSYEGRSAALGWRTPFEVAQEAYRQHVSQQKWTGFYVYDFGHPYDSHRFGLFRTLVGPDESHDDLMEHVSREEFPVE